MSAAALPKDVKTMLFACLETDRDKMALRASCRQFREASNDLPFAVQARKGVEAEQMRLESAERMRRVRAREECCRGVLLVLTCGCCCGMFICDDQEGD